MWAKLCKFLMFEHLILVPVGQMRPFHIIIYFGPMSLTVSPQEIHDLHSWCTWWWSCKSWGITWASCQLLLKVFSHCPCLLKFLSAPASSPLSCWDPELSNLQNCLFQMYAAQCDCYESLVWVITVDARISSMHMLVPHLRNLHVQQPYGIQHCGSYWDPCVEM